MRVLIVHHESEYFAGAEKVLGYFLEGLEADCDATVAAVRESRVAGIIPARMKTCWLPANTKFSLLQLVRQVAAIRRHFQTEPFDVVHGWAARDWELTACAGWRTRRPALGTLHDHPQASFISPARRRLMSWSARLGLGKVVCVSGAVQRACVQAGYDSTRLAVVHNGLPPRAVPRTGAVRETLRLGYLGVFSERKGLKGLFEILDRLALLTPRPWTMAVAGEAQENAGRRLVQEIQEQHARKSWWSQVEWHGWVKQPTEFLSSLDVLICPSSEFDPFPTVVLEAGQAGVPVLGARVGGVPEIIEEGQTGWLFACADWAGAARQLQRVLEEPGLARVAGEQAKKRVEREFTMKRMVQNYLNMYLNLAPL